MAPAFSNIANYDLTRHFQIQNSIKHLMYFWRESYFYVSGLISMVCLVNMMIKYSDINPMKVPMAREMTKLKDALSNIESKQSMALERTTALLLPNETTMEMMDFGFDLHETQTNETSNTIKLHRDQSHNTGDNVRNEAVHRNQYENQLLHQQLADKVRIIGQMEVQFERLHQQNQGLRDNIANIKWNYTRNSQSISMDKDSLEVKVRTSEAVKQHLEKRLKAIEYAHFEKSNALQVVTKKCLEYEQRNETLNATLRGAIQRHRMGMDKILQQMTFIENEKLQSEEAVVDMQSIIKEKDQSFRILDTKYWELQRTYEKLVKQQREQTNASDDRMDNLQSVIREERNRMAMEMRKVQGLSAALEEDVILKRKHIENLSKENRCLKEENGRMLKMKVEHEKIVEEEKEKRRRLEVESERKLKENDSERLLGQIRDLTDKLSADRERNQKEIEQLHDQIQKLKDKLIEIEDAAAHSAQEGCVLRLKVSTLSGENEKLKTSNISLSDQLRNAAQSLIDYQTNAGDQIHREQEKNHDLEHTASERTRIDGRVIAELMRGGKDLKCEMEKYHKEIRFWQNGAQRLQHHIDTQQNIIAKLHTEKMGIASCANERDRKKDQKEMAMKREIEQLHLKYNMLCHQRETGKSEMKTKCEQMFIRIQALQQQLEAQDRLWSDQIQIIQKIRIRAKSAFALIEVIRSQGEQSQMEPTLWSQKSMKVQGQWTYFEEQISKSLLKINENNLTSGAALEREKLKVVQLNKINDEQQQIHKKIQSDHWKQMECMRTDMAKLIHLLEEERNKNADLLQYRDDNELRKKLMEQEYESILKDKLQSIDGETVKIGHRAKAVIFEESLPNKLPEKTSKTDNSEESWIKEEQHGLKIEDKGNHIECKSIPSDSPIGIWI